MKLETNFRTKFESVKYEKKKFIYFQRLFLKFLLLKYSNRNYLSQLIPKKKQKNDVNRMTLQIEVREHKNLTTYIDTTIIETMLIEGLL